MPLDCQKNILRYNYVMLTCWKYHLYTKSENQKCYFSIHELLEMLALGCQMDVLCMYNEVHEDNYSSIIL